MQVGWKLATKFSVFASDAGANAARTLIERARPRGKEEERRWIDDPVFAEEAWVDQVLSRWHEAGADAESPDVSTQTRKEAACPRLSFCCCC